MSVHQMSPPQQLRQQTSNCSPVLTYRPRKDERLSWPSWLTYSGWFTHKEAGNQSWKRNESDQLQCWDSTFYAKLLLRLTLVAVAVAAAGNDDGVRQQVVADQTQQLAGYLLVVVVGRGLRTLRLHKRWLLFLAELVRMPVHAQTVTNIIMHTITNTTTTIRFPGKPGLAGSPSV